MTISESVAEVFTLELNVPSEEIRPSLKYGEIPEWDSNSHMVLITALEERFGIEFDSDEIVEMTSVEAITSALEAKGAA